MSEQKLGKVIVRYATQKRGLSSPAEIHAYMERAASELGRDVEVARSRSSVGKYLRSETAPSEEWIELFGLCFHLTGTEILDLHARAQT